MKFGRRHASDNDPSHEMCSEQATHCCKCYDISEIFSTETRQTTSLSKQSSECVETDISTEPAGSSLASEFTSSSPIKTRIKWTTDLHDKFVECVNYLGGPMKATPKQILKMMRTDELTIYKVKSHLQKYRTHKHVQNSMQGTSLKEQEIHLEGSGIKEFMRLQDKVGQHLQEQLEVSMTLARNPSRFTTLLKRLSHLSVENPFTPPSSATQKPRSFATQRTRNGIRVTPTIRKMAEEAMLDYFYSTRSLQYMVAESMSKNSPIFIENLLKKVSCVSASDINQSITKHLRFHPVNEFEPFLESSGLKPDEYTHLIPSGEIFLNELLLENHHVLCYCGVDPKKIGKIFEEARDVFGYETGVLASKIKAYEDFGFSRLFLSKLIACCPRMLVGGTDMELVKVIEKLRAIGIDSDWVMKNLSEEVSYNWSSVHCALTLLRVVCNDENELYRLIKNYPRLIFESSGRWTLILVGFETKLGLSARELYSLFQKLPQMQVEKCVSNLRRCFLFLKEIDMEDDEIQKVFRSHSWWISSCTLKKTSSLLVNLKAYKTRVCKVVKENPEEMKKWTMGSKVHPLPATEVYLDSKAMKTQFLLDLGYVEGSEEMERAGKSFRGRGSELKERFDVLVRFGLDEEDVKEMVKASPNILTQASDVLETKVRYLVEELGYPLSTLVTFPSCLKFTLERMKVRFAMFAWLKGRGKADPKLAVSTLLACSDKDFARYFVSRHPDGPKHLEDLKKKQQLL
ncbi:unnamed protein product [Brassica rapa subsp. narinosa]